MNRAAKLKRIAIVSALVEGNSLRATARMRQADVHTVMGLLEDVGRACAEYQDKALRNLISNRIQGDEIWSFCYAKEKNVPEEKRGRFGFGEVWTWIAIDPDTKLVPSFMVGDRGTAAARAFMEDLASRLKNRIQLRQAAIACT